MAAIRIIGRLIDYFLIFLVVSQFGQLNEPLVYLDPELEPIPSKLVITTQVVVLPTVSPTKTPFQPNVSPSWPLSTQEQFAQLLPMILVPPPPIIPEVVAKTVYEPSMKFMEINFNNRQQKIYFKILPKNKSINRGKTIAINFVPGKRCNFGDKRACVYAFLNEIGQNIIFISIHSGVGGEAQDFRHAVEGTGINSAGLILSKVRDNLNSLAGSKVTISQNGREIEGELVGVARIPSKSVNKYLDSAISEALKIAARYDPKLKAWVASDEPLVIFETCGWRMPGESWSPGTSDTTGSIYLGIIHLVP